MKKVNYFLAGMMLILVASCKEPEDFTTKYDSIVPDPVSNVAVENINGGAIISYTLPDHEDMLGAKIAYSLTIGGEVMERYASTKESSIELEGFGDTDERTVVIYAVHKSGNVSAGTEVTIKPLIPPIQIIRESLKAETAWGGIKILWDNPLRKQMGIALYVEDPESKEMILFDRYYSTSLNGKVYFRPFDPKEQRFRIEMFDRWTNHADPLDTKITPLEEIEILGCNYHTIEPPTEYYWSLFDDGRVIPGDNTSPWRYTYRCDIHNTDGQTSRTFNPYGIWWHSTSGTDMWAPGGDGIALSYYIPGASAGNLIESPVYITFDMGRKAVYSRMAYLTRRRSPNFSANMPVEFTVWGCNNPKTVEEVEDPHGIYEKGSREANQAYWCSWKVANGTDAWKKDWVKIADCKLELSSGANIWSENMPLTNEDIDRYITTGWHFEFPDDVTEAYRYLRWEIHTINRPPQALMMAGLKYWGSYAND